MGESCFSTGSLVGAILGTFFGATILSSLVFFLVWSLCLKRNRDGSHNSYCDTWQWKSSTDNRSPGCGSNFNVASEASTLQIRKPVDSSPTSNIVKKISELDVKQPPYGKPGLLRRTKDIRQTPSALSPAPFERSVDGPFILPRIPSSGSLQHNQFESDLLEVSLQSHDAVGLGFNITGNMTDGIFVSELLRRGPASESGLINPGDRILGLSIKFEHMVFEDALTILSYASSYPVRMTLQKMPTVSDAYTSLTTGSEPPISPSPQLRHPRYRSQSVDDVSCPTWKAASLTALHRKYRNTFSEMGANNIELSVIASDIPIGSDIRIPSRNPMAIESRHCRKCVTRNKDCLDLSRIDGANTHRTPAPSRETKSKSSLELARRGSASATGASQTGREVAFMRGRSSSENDLSKITFAPDLRLVPYFGPAR